MRPVSASLLGRAQACDIRALSHAPGLLAGGRHEANAPCACARSQASLSLIGRAQACDIRALSHAPGFLAGSRHEANAPCACARSQASLPLSLLALLLSSYKHPALPSGYLSQASGARRSYYMLRRERSRMCTGNLYLASATSTHIATGEKLLQDWKVTSR